MPGVTTAMSLAVSEDDQGAVAGANSAAQGLGRLFGPLIGSKLYEILPALPYSIAAGLMTLVLGFVIISKSTRNKFVQPAA
jgi:MFS family permease